MPTDRTDETPAPRWRLLPGEPWMERCGSGEWVKFSDLHAQLASVTQERDTLTQEYLDYVQAHNGCVDAAIAETEQQRRAAIATVTHERDQKEASRGEAQLRFLSERQRRDDAEIELAKVKHAAEASLTEARTALEQLRAFVQGMADEKLCDDEGEAVHCSGGSGPYCERHDLWHETFVRAARALLPPHEGGSQR